MSEVQIKDKLPEVNQEEMMEQMEDGFERAKKALEALDDALAIQATGDTNKTPEMAACINQALECLDIGLEAEQGSFKTMINNVIALIMRMFESMVDYIRRSQIKAREYINACNAIISSAKNIPTGATTDLSVTNAATMLVLSFEGNSPRYLTRDLDTFFADVIRSRAFVPTPEIRAIVNNIRSGKSIDKEFTEFHNKLKAGLLGLGDAVSTDSKEVYSSANPALAVYSTKRVIGDRFIFGQISEITENQKFEYSCIAKRDNQTKLRVKNFSALRPNDISLVARTVRIFCEDLIRNVSIERDLYQVIRDVKALNRMDPNRTDITALRTIVATTQSTYLVRVRHALVVCEYVLYYLRDSIKCYNKTLKEDNDE